MAIRDTKNIVAVTGEYTDRNGQNKKRYMTVGTLFIFDDGGYGIKMDAIPTGNWDGKLQVYDKRDNNQQQPQQGYHQQNNHNQQHQQGYGQQGNYQ